MTSRMWASDVKPGAKIVLRPSVNSGSYSPPPPPPPSLPPQTSAPPSTSAPLLKPSEVWDAKGPHTLPFHNCGNRIFRFFDYSIPESLELLNQYRTLIERAPPERWSDQHGNAVAAGSATALDRPQVNIGPVLAGRLSGLQDKGGCRYVVVLRARLNKRIRDKDVSAHLDGDSIYQWAPYSSLEQAQAEVVESLGLGYSIMGSWAVLDVSKVSTAKLAHFAGKIFVVGNRKVFAVVDAVSSRGWRRRLRLVYSIGL